MWLYIKVCRVARVGLPADLVSFRRCPGLPADCVRLRWGSGVLALKPLWGEPFGKARGRAGALKD